MPLSVPDARTPFTKASLILSERVYALTEVSIDPGSLWLGAEVRRWNRSTVRMTVGRPFLRLDVHLARSESGR